MKNRDSLPSETTQLILNGTTFVLLNSLAAPAEITSAEKENKQRLAAINAEIKAHQDKQQYQSKNHSQQVHKSYSLKQPQHFDYGQMRRVKRSQHENIKDQGERKTFTKQG